ncbi:MAG: hypothetical protein KC933_21655 [Myxococcales bacterium]|nr:hypothetical protein [Myxococcales bacterium]
MNVTELFKAMAGNAEQKLDKLLDRQTGNLDKQRELSRLEERFQEMASDGLLDEEEMDELLAMMRQNGLDADGIQQIFESLKGEDSSVRLDDADKLKFMIETRIDNAQDLFSDSQSDLNFQIQMAVSDYTHGNEAASTLSKREHDTYMAVIRNMVG